YAGELVHQALNVAESLQHFAGSGIFRKLDLTAKIKPLNHLLHVGAAEILIVSFGNRAADEFAANVIGALHLTFVFELQLAGDGRQGGIDITNPRNCDRLTMANGSALGVGDDILHAGNRKALTDARALVNFLVLAGGKGDSFDDFANVFGDDE